MKTTQQIVGLPVISISDGNEIGMVKMSSSMPLRELWISLLSTAE